MLLKIKMRFKSQHKNEIEIVIENGNSIKN